MSVPPISVPVETLSERPFSFYPPILNVEHNEWNFRQASWAEILVEKETVDAEELQELLINRDVTVASYV
ncbi:MAG: hypothetical protein NTY38_12620 [Acidobacteria bacterium]|nr:hypothetical protein [Acidobacteriota bacterium]